MSFIRVLTILFMAVVFVWTTSPTLAQTTTPAPPKPADAAKAPDPAKPSDIKPQTTPGAATTDAKDKDDKNKKVAKKSAKKQHAKKADEDNDRSNKGGETRGLDRADQAAGAHGQQGRDNARSKQGR